MPNRPTGPPGAVQLVHHLTASLETSMAFKATKTAFQSCAGILTSRRLASRAGNYEDHKVLALPERRAETSGDTQSYNRGHRRA
jgi:hypothetical protein